MIARAAVKPTMTTQIIENCLCIDFKYCKQMDPMELSSLKKLLDRITAMGVAVDYDQIGLKPDQIGSPQTTK